MIRDLLKPILFDLIRNLINVNPQPPEGGEMLLEDGTDILLEDGSNILLEGALVFILLEDGSNILLEDGTNILGE